MRKIFKTVAILILFVNVVKFIIAVIANKKSLEAGVGLASIDEQLKAHATWKNAIKKTIFSNK